MLMIDSLIPMQNTLREAEQLPEMVEFIRGGGLFNEETLVAFASKKREESSKLFKLNPIKIIVFEDGAMYIHDGLHRSTAIWIAGRKFLDPKEYTIEKWTYKEYLEISIKDKWYTPFDPRKEVRINDFLFFKKLVEEFINKDPHPTDKEIECFILDHYGKKSYTESRSVNRISEVASRLTLTEVKVE